MRENDVLGVIVLIGVPLLILTLNYFLKGKEPNSNTKRSSHFERFQKLIQWQNTLSPSAQRRRRGK